MRSLEYGLGVRTASAAAVAAFALSACSGGSVGHDSAAPEITPTPTAAALEGPVTCPSDEVFQTPLPGADALYFHGNPEDPYYAGIRRMLQSGNFESEKCQLEKLAQVPVGSWVGDWTKDVYTTVRQHVSGARDTHKMPLLVGYNIPGRDRGQHSKGGATDADAYRVWTKAFSDGLGDLPSVVVWEPDALAQSLDLEPEESQERLGLLRAALQMFHDRNPNAKIYIDAGNGGWMPAWQMAELLKQADGGSGLINAIALNVSNYGRTESEAAYANEIEAAFGRGLDVLIDTSRNGADVPNRKDFCNNPYARVGDFALSFYDPDAEITRVHVKELGRSDGACKPGQLPAGYFDDALLMTQIGVPIAPYG